MPRQEIKSKVKWLFMFAIIFAFLSGGLISELWVSSPIVKAVIDGILGVVALILGLYGVSRYIIDKAEGAAEIEMGLETSGAGYKVEKEKNK